MDGKTILITGGNSGIGLETVIALARMGARVVLTVRTPEKGERTAALVRERAGREVEWLELDLASFASIRTAAAEALDRCPRLDVLINNAGLMLGSRRLTAEGFETTFGVNHLGHFLLTDLLLERIRQSAPARIVTVASRVHRFSSGLRFDDLQYSRGYSSVGAYAHSKLANISFTRELARRLDGTGVTANALHPGLVGTRLALDGDAPGPMAWFFRLGRPFLRTPVQGARTSVHLASAPDLVDVTGRYFADEREARPSRVALDDAAARRLWEVSTELVRGAGTP